MTKLYVIVDQSLSRRQQFVQGAHAVAQHLVDYPDSEWKNGTLVMLKTKDLEKLTNLFSEKEIKHSKFHEPYYGNMLTAISALNIEDFTCKLNLI